MPASRTGPRCHDGARTISHPSLVSGFEHDITAIPVNVRGPFASWLQPSDPGQVASSMDLICHGYADI
jgi:hypothetical protein